MSDLLLHFNKMLVALVSAGIFLKCLAFNPPVPANLTRRETPFGGHIANVSGSYAYALRRLFGGDVSVSVNAQNLALARDEVTGRITGVLVFPAFLALALWVASSANGYQVGFVIMGFVAVYVVYMQRLARRWMLGAADLTGVAVSLTNDTGDTFPPRRIVPFGNAPLPCGVLCSGLKTDMGLGDAPSWYAKLAHKFKHNARIDFAFFGNLRHGHAFIPVRIIEPVTVVMWLDWIAMALDKGIPSVLAAVPQYGPSAFALAARRCLTFGGQILDRLHMSLRSGWYANYSIVMRGGQI